VDRGKPGKAVISRMVDHLRAGKAALIFPEGTRSRDGRLQRARRGVPMLALAARVPVVPVFVAGTRRAMPPGAVLPRPGRITIVFGEPIWPEEFTHRLDAGGRPTSRRQDQEALGERLMAAIRQLAHEQGAEI
jgi:1-acyl-sn-glycerol-3-phosphate acyltransferase